MYRVYVKALRDQVRQSKAVKKQASLRGEKWTISGYEQLADMITQSLLQNLNADEQRTMGTTISAKTLANIFKDDYKPSYPMDPRTVNSLTKLCVFVGYGGWDDFVLAMDEQQTSIPSVDDHAILEKGMRHISRYMLSILDNIRCHDHESHRAMIDYQIKDTSKCLHPVDGMAKEFAEQGWTINNPFNPTEAEMLDFELMSVDGDTTLFKTKERWLLCWYDTEIKKYVKRWDRTMAIEYRFVTDTEGKMTVVEVGSLQ